MSKLKVTTISDPDNDNTALTIDTSGNLTVPQNLTVSGTLSGNGSNLTGISQGITDASQWRLNTNHNVYNNDVIGANDAFEAFDDGNYGTLGSAMTESSGVFTFPSTGIWWIQFIADAQIINQNGYLGAKISTTYNNGSNWDDAVEHYHTNGSTDWYRPIPMDFIFDVASTSTHKVRFIGLENGGLARFVGDTNVGRTTVTFFKLGET